MNHFFKDNQKANNNHIFIMKAALAVMLIIYTTQGFFDV